MEDTLQISFSCSLIQKMVENKNIFELIEVNWKDLNGTREKRINITLNILSSACILPFKSSLEILCSKF